MRVSSIAAVSCLVLGVAACMPAAGRSKGPQHVRPEDNARVSGRYVPSGQKLSVRIEQPLDTAATPRGTAFSAVVLQPLNDNTGAVLVPVGARLRGHLHSSSGATGERLRLRFEGIDTTLGQAAIAARVDDATYATYSGAPRVMPRPYSWGGGPGYYGWYGGWGYYDYDIYIPREVHLPAGGVMNLTLTRPLLAPGAASIAH